MAAKKLAFHVTVDGEDGPVTYGPDDTVPAAVQKQITNPAAWAAEGDDAEDDTESEAEPTNWEASMTKPKLQAVIDARNEGRAEEGQIVPAGTNKPDLIAALEADDAASA